MRTAIFFGLMAIAHSVNPTIVISDATGTLYMIIGLMCMVGDTAELFSTPKK